MSRRKTLFVCFTLGVTSVLLILTAELVLRLFFPQPPSWLDIYMLHPRLPFYAILPNQSKRIDAGEGDYQFRSDSNGFRVPVDYQEEIEPNKAELLILGDSFGFGQGLNEEESFVGILRQKNPDLRIINTSVGGYGPEQYRDILRDRLETGLIPARILVQFFMGNDFYDCIWSKNITVISNGILGGRVGLKNWLKRKTHLYRLISKVLHTVWVPESKYAYTTRVKSLLDEEEWRSGELQKANKEFREAVQAIGELAKEHNIPITAVILPIRETIKRLQDENAPEDDKKRAMLPNKHAISALRAANIPFIDTTERLHQHPIKDAYLPWDGHFNFNGSMLVADLLHEKLFKNAEQPVLDPAAPPKLQSEQ